MGDLHFRKLFTSFTLWKSFPHISTLKAVNRVLDPVHWNGSRTELCSHAKEGSVIQEQIQTQNCSENTSLTVLNWNGSENTFAVHTDIEPSRDRFRVLCG